MPVLPLLYRVRGGIRPGRWVAGRPSAEQEGAGYRLWQQAHAPTPAQLTDVTIQDRIKLWREDAAALRRRGSRRAAALMERLAAELEDDLRGGTDDDGEQVPELVEMRAAVALSGYTRGHLRRMLVARTLTNYGTDARPLFRASDLPRKPVGRRPPQAN